MAFVAGIVDVDSSSELRSGRFVRYRSLTSLIVKALIDRDEDILHQCRTKGYTEEEVSDDDGREEELATPPVRRRPATSRKRPATMREDQAGYTG